MHKKGLKKIRFEPLRRLFEAVKNQDEDYEKAMSLTQRRKGKILDSSCIDKKGQWTLNESLI